MNKVDFVNARRSRYMAQVLEGFEEHIEPHLGREHRGHVQDFKGLVRARIGALAADAIEAINLEPNVVINAAGQDLRDAVSPSGR